MTELKKHCDMMNEKGNSGARETVIARERLGKHIVSATTVTSRNYRRAEGSGVASLPAPGGLCRCNGTSDTIHPLQQRHGVFCWVRA
jgi:hypothetical protein